MSTQELTVRNISDPFCSSRTRFEELVGRLDSAETMQMTHSQLERFVDVEGRELLRRLFQDHLDLRVPGEADARVVSAGGAVLTHRRNHVRPLETIFGKVSVTRKGYGARGVDSLHPLDAELNLPDEKYSLEVRRRVAVEAVKTSFDETVTAMDENTGARVPKRQAEELVVRAAVDFDTFYTQGRGGCGEVELAETGPILVLSVDGKGIVMRREDLRAATRKMAESREHKLVSRLSKGEKRNTKRMAEVAAVYTIEPHIRKAEDVIGALRPVREGEQPPPKPEQKRVWASVEKDMESVMEEAFQEGLRRDPNRSKKWVALVDGNKTQLKALKRLARKYRIRLTIVVDFVHALEYLWRAGNALLGEGERQTEAWVVERALRLLNGEASCVAAGIRRSATLRGLTGSARRAMDKCADYLLKNARHMRYGQCLKQGYPIATGVIEGACRHLVKDRMDITGARWGLECAEAILKLRALRSSGDLDAYWKFHEAKEFERNHAARYGAPIPSTGQSNIRRNGDGRHLHLVK